MEDHYLVSLSIRNHPDYSLFAVFDGFNGTEAAKYLTDNLVNVLSELKSLNDAKLIINTLVDMDKDFLKLKHINHAGSTILFALVKTLTVQKSDYEYDLIDHSVDHDVEQEAKKANYLHSPTDSTPISKNISNSLLQSVSLSSEEKTVPNPSGQKQEYAYDVNVFWVGDSRSFVFKDGGLEYYQTKGLELKYEQLTFDHRCCVETESKRIIENGNTIIDNKLDGVSLLSRSFWLSWH
eukprot:UN09529